VRDEARMTTSAYETLYESSIAYGVRKALVAEQKKIDLNGKINGKEGVYLLVFPFFCVFFCF
jgi:dynein light intermediate chain